MKYKKCCDRICLVRGCNIRENGGCYCVCRLHDAIKQQERVISGNVYWLNGGVIYEPGRTPIPLEGDEKEQAETKLVILNEKMKKYEIADEI